MNLSRRKALRAGGGAGVLAMLLAAGIIRPGDAVAQQQWNQAAFNGKTLKEALQALGAQSPAASDAVLIKAPEIAENGAVVPVGASTMLPGVKRMLLLVEKNPTMLSAIFDVSDAIEANFSTRVKMGQSSNVYAVAMMADGKVYYAAKEIKVTLGGCGG